MVALLCTLSRKAMSFSSRSYAFHSWEQITIESDRTREHVESSVNINTGSRFVPKSTPENEPLSSYASAIKKKKKKMEKIEGLANFSLTC